MLPDPLYIPAENAPSVLLPLYADPCPAGFPQPAADYVENTLDLNEYCIRSAPSTFFVRAKGSSMVLAGISDGDLLIVDKSLEAKHGDIVIAAVDGSFTVKRLCTHPHLCLQPMNPEYTPIYFDPDNLEIFGVVTFSVHKMG
ncbi:translesion error-prone DNA polymerase V autoproteolytic subunit [Serratia ficaria]|uniref:translesion error-prone DNA polymerase V autoproteolytic subunit n=1 Tax=Serratia ficaria TaxID=61651 RepID=UPI0021C7BC9A|nr:translesion error-prone DNA polymerase V autoproteolytic subunit [Serratia ficaria]